MSSIMRAGKVFVFSTDGNPSGAAGTYSSTAMSDGGAGGSSAIKSDQQTFLAWIESRGFDPERCGMLAEAWNAALDAAIAELDQEWSRVLEDLKAP